MQLAFETQFMELISTGPNAIVMAPKRHHDAPSSHEDYWTLQRPFGPIVYAVSSLAGDLWTASHTRNKVQCFVTGTQLLNWDSTGLYGLYGLMGRGIGRDAPCLQWLPALEVQNREGLYLRSS
jgi:hypothetical protein